MLRDCSEMLDFVSTLIKPAGVGSGEIPSFVPASLRRLYRVFGARMATEGLFRFHNSLYLPSELEVRDGLVCFIMENQGCDSFWFEPGSDEPQVFSDLGQYEEPPVDGIIPFDAPFENVLMTHCLRELVLWQREQGESPYEYSGEKKPLFLDGQLDMTRAHHNFYLTKGGQLIMTER